MAVEPQATCHRVLLVVLRRLQILLREFESCNDPFQAERR